MVPWPCACSTLSEFVSFWPLHHFYCLRVCLILLHVLVGVYLLWCEGCVGFRAHALCLSPLLRLGVAWAKSPRLLAEPMFSFSMFMGLLAIKPAISLHHVCHSFTSPFISCYSVGLQAGAPTVPAHFFINLLLRASLAHFSYLYLFWASLANIPVVPAHFTTSFLELP